MRTVFVTGDSWITDAAMIMADLEYLFNVGTIKDTDTFITTNAAGVEATIAPLLQEAGLSVVPVTDISEPDIVVVLLSEKEERAHEIMMNQWRSHKAVYPFIKVKK